jgi:hypothetical protein
MAVSQPQARFIQADRMSKRRVVTFALLLLALGSLAAGATLIFPKWRLFHDPQRDNPLAAFVVQVNDEVVRAEAGLEGHRDLAFENQANNPFTVFLDRMDCECAHLLLCLAPQAWQNLDAATIVSRSEDKALDWQSLEPGSKGFNVPPHARGLLRLTWNTPVAGKHKLGASLLLDNGTLRELRRVEAPVQLLEIVSLRAEDDPKTRGVEVGFLKPGEERKARFVCFSQTRDHFSVKPAATNTDPCVIYGTPIPLSGEELRPLSEKTGINVLSGYRVAVTIREKADNARLDLGPFRRKIIWKTDVFSGHQVSAEVEGTVQGEVSLKVPEDMSFVDLGTFLPTDDKSWTFTLSSEDSQLRLTLDSDKSLNFLNVELLDGAEGKPADSGKSWRVRIKFRSESFFRGSFPNADRAGYDSAVLCSVVFVLSHPDTASPAKDAAKRRLYVPIRGNVRSF